MLRSSKKRADKNARGSQGEASRRFLTGPASLYQCCEVTPFKASHCPGKLPYYSSAQGWQTNLMREMLFLF